MHDQCLYLLTFNSQSCSFFASIKSLPNGYLVIRSYSWWVIRSRALINTELMLWFHSFGVLTILNFVISVTVLAYLDCVLTKDLSALSLYVTNTPVFTLGWKDYSGQGPYLKQTTDLRGVEVCSMWHEWMWKLHAAGGKQTSSDFRTKTARSTYLSDVAAALKMIAFVIFFQMIRDSNEHDDTILLCAEDDTTSRSSDDSIPPPSCRPHIIGKWQQLRSPDAHLMT